MTDRPDDGAPVTQAECFAAGIEAAARVAESEPGILSGHRRGMVGATLADQCKMVANAIRALEASPAQVASAPDREGVDALIRELRNPWQDGAPMERGALPDWSYDLLQRASHALAALSARPSLEGES